MKLSDILHQSEYEGTAAENIEFTRICHDTRDAEDGCLFVVLPGKKHDALSLLAKSDLCPAAVIVKKGSDTRLIPFPILSVPSPHRTLAFLWSRLFGSPERSLRIYGITGTAGKTSTAEMLCATLKKSGRSVGLIGTIACRANDLVYPENDGTVTMTTPEPKTLYPLLRNMKERGVTDVVMEISSQALAQERCAPIEFEVAVFTNLSPEHLDYHETMENYFRAKASLFENARISVLNADDPSFERLSGYAKGKAVSVSATKDADYRATSAVIGTSVSYTWVTKRFSTKLSLGIPGIFTVYNSLLAAAAATEAGVLPLTVKEAFSEIRMISGRMEKLDTKRFSVGYSIVIDYAHTPEALRNLLKSVRPLTEGRILLVFGCGGDRDREKRAAMGRIAAEYADFLIVTADNSRSESVDSIISDILKGIPDGYGFHVINDRKEAIETALSEAKEGDLLLLVGKGHEKYEIRGNLLYPFDEREIVFAWLNEREAKKDAD